MATNDDLDDFFKKKDRKANKPKKQTGLLTNNEKLLKQLVIVTSATSAFKENMNFDDDEDEQYPVDNAIKPAVEPPPPPPPPVPVANTKAFHQEQTNAHEDNSSIDQKQDDWEEFEDSNSKYEALRLKFARANHNHDDDDDDDDDNNDDIGNVMINDENHLQTGEREQAKDKPVWKLDQMKLNEINIPVVEDIVEKPPSPVKISSSGAYRPPQLRSASSVTIVGGTNCRVSKKKQPNLASTEEFPTLGSTVNKK